MENTEKYKLIDKLITQRQNLVNQFTVLNRFTGNSRNTDAIRLAQQMILEFDKQYKDIITKNLV